LQWENHGTVDPPPSFNCVHAALIPTLPYRGCVIAWDYESGTVAGYQRYSIIDPNGGIQIGGVNYTFVNRWIPMPEDEGDLFCPGLAWDQRGRLFLAGGTTGWPPPPGAPFQFADDPLHPSTQPPWRGGRMVWLFDPTRPDPNHQGAVFGEWSEIVDPFTQGPARMQRYRWYPTVTFDHNDTMVITGGIHNAVQVNSYEAMKVLDQGLNSWAEGTYDVHTSASPPLDRVFQGPTGNVSYFEIYPRFHMLTDGSLLMSGFFGNWARKEHPLLPGPDAGWNVQGGTLGLFRYYGSSFLMPNPSPGGWNVVMRTGGHDNQQPVANVTATVDYYNSATSTWVPYTPMTEARHTHNTVPLPDGTVLVVGGNRSGEQLNCDHMPTNAVRVPELLTSTGWVHLSNATHVSPRVYHSVALLLPDARVFVAGGECRTKDYEVYRPPYLTGGRPRPTGVQVSAEVLHYGSMYNVQFLPFPEEEVLTTVAKVVLIRPGAVTHHTDMDTRYLELVSQPGAGSSRDFLAPANSKQAPRGWYMLFLVTNEKVPSVAAWVRLE